jgi:hypothetical protein
LFPDDPSEYDSVTPDVMVRVDVAVSMSVVPVVSVPVCESVDR